MSLVSACLRGCRCLTSLDVIFNCSIVHHVMFAFKVLGIRCFRMGWLWAVRRILGGVDFDVGLVLSVLWVIVFLSFACVWVA